MRIGVAISVLISEGVVEDIPNADAFIPGLKFYYGFRIIFRLVVAIWSCCVGLGSHIAL